MKRKIKARRLLRKRLAEMPERWVFNKSYAACLNLCKTSVFREAKVVMMYLPMPAEADLTLALLEALRCNKTVAVPRTRDKAHMDAVSIETLNCAMQQDKWGIREPTRGALIQPADFDLIVVPGLGFDTFGRRLGRGAGYYDRFLAEAAGTTCGFAFEEQLLEDLPVEPHDQEIDLLVTDQTTRVF